MRVVGGVSVGVGGGGRCCEKYQATSFSAIQATLLQGWCFRHVH